MNQHGMEVRPTTCNRRSRHALDTVALCTGSYITRSRILRSRGQNLRTNDVSKSEQNLHSEGAVSGMEVKQVGKGTIAPHVDDHGHRIAIHEGPANRLRYLGWDTAREALDRITPAAERSGGSTRSAIPVFDGSSEVALATILRLPHTCSAICLHSALSTQLK